MARMSIDDKVARDPRIDRLARMCGWSRRETRACMEDVWALCYDRVVPYLPADDIETAALRDAISQPDHPGGFVDAIKRCGLARDAVARDRFFEKKDGSKLPWPDSEWRDRIYLAGTSERIGYLLTQRESGHRGGVKSGQSRRNQDEGSLKQASSSASSDPQGSTNPSASASASTLPSASPPDPDTEREERESASPSARSPQLQVLTDKVDTATGDIGRARARKKPSEPTAEERTSAMFVLRKLGDRNGVKYSGAKDHVKLIADRLREGISEDDMRKVIGYCAIELEWQDDPKMSQFLRPDTLFGKQTIHRYLDPARTWFEKQGLELEPRLEVVS